MIIWYFQSTLLIFTNACAGVLLYIDSAHCTDVHSLSRYIIYAYIIRCNTRVLLTKHISVTSAAVTLTPVGISTLILYNVTQCISVAKTVNICLSYNVYFVTECVSTVKTHRNNGRVVVCNGIKVYIYIYIERRRGNKREKKGKNRKDMVY